LRAALKRAGVPKRLTAALSGSLRTRGFLLWGAALATGILCVSQHVYSTKLAEEIEQLRNAREDLEAEIGFLSLEHARLAGRERIERYAMERLSMRYPEAHEVVRLGDGTQDSWNRWGDDLVEEGTVAVNDG
jgi:cell division protein FtsL